MFLPIPQQAFQGPHAIWDEVVRFQEIEVLCFKLV